jgi:hypothetical protein
MRGNPSGLFAVVCLVRAHAAVASPAEVVVDISSAQPVIWSDLKTRQTNSAGEVLREGLIDPGTHRFAVALVSGATQLQVTSPYYRPCHHALQNDEHEYSCSLNPNLRLNPFAPGTGAVWIRRAPDGEFRRAPEVPLENGGGFAADDGIGDVVLASKGRCATIALGVVISRFLGHPAEKPSETRPWAVAAQLTDSAGIPLNDAPRLELVDPSSPPEGAARVDAQLDGWRGFYRSVGFTQAKDGVVTVAPVPCRPLWFFARIPHRRFATLSTTNNVSGIHFVGAIPLPRLARLRVDVAPGSFQNANAPELLLEGRLLEPAKGLPMPGPLARSARVKVSAERLVETLELYPGRWLMSLRSLARVLGERSALLLEDGDGEMSFSIGMRRIAGQVADSRDHPIVGAEVRIHYLTDPANALASASSDDSGSFAAEVLHGGGALVLTVSTPGGGHSFRPLDESLDWEHLRMKLSPGVVRVVVRDKLNGKTVEGVTVYLVVAQASDSSRAEMSTDSEGIALFENLDLGEIKLTGAGTREWQPEPGDLGKTSKLTPEHPKAEFAVNVHRAAEVSVSLEGTVGGGVVFGPLSSQGDPFPAAWPAAADGKARVVRAVDGTAPALFAATAPGYRVTFFELPSDAMEGVVRLSPRRREAAVRFRVPDSDFGMGLGIQVATHGQFVPHNVLSLLMTRFGGCSLVMPPTVGTESFDRCLDDDAYWIAGFDVLSRETVPIAPSRVELREGTPTDVVIEKPRPR